MADLTIDSADRIVNRTSPRDPDDKSEANADNFMLIWDGIVNGKYRIRPCKVYTLEATLLATTGEPFERAGALDTGQEWKWGLDNGTWKWLPI